MGTNFYYRTEHIGKRSAAGWYCWECGVTLCKAGIDGVHHGREEWHDACPKCGAMHGKASLGNSCVGRELGFNKSTPSPKRGVSGCSSFTWAVRPEDLWMLVGRVEPKGAAPAVIMDEYNREYTPEEFEAVLSECPIQYADSIGSEFS